MMIASLATIGVLHLVAVVTPGPNALLISQIAASHQGGRAGFAVLGVMAGAFVWSTSAILGVNLLFHAFPALRLGLQVAGGMYLLYSGWRLWRAGAAAGAGDAAAPPLSRAAAFRQGLLTNVTNPKSALFFGSIFAAAMPPAPGLPMQALTVALVVFNAMWWYGLLAYLFSRPRVRAAYARARGGINRLAAGLFGLLGLGLLGAALRDARGG